VSKKTKKTVHQQHYTQISFHKSRKSYKQHTKRSNNKISIFWKWWCWWDVRDILYIADLKCRSQVLQICRHGLSYNLHNKRIFSIAIWHLVNILKPFLIRNGSMNVLVYNDVSFFYYLLFIHIYIYIQLLYIY